MSDNMQPTDETLDDESLDAVDAEATEAYDEVEEFDPFEGMSDEELDACATRMRASRVLATWNPVSQRLRGPGRPSQRR